MFSSFLNEEEEQEEEEQEEEEADERVWLQQLPFVLLAQLQPTKSSFRKQ